MSGTGKSWEDKGKVPISYNVFFPHMAGNPSNDGVYGLGCFSDYDGAQFQISSYAALHRGRPPERPLNCKRTLHLGGFAFS